MRFQSKYVQNVIHFSQVNRDLLIQAEESVNLKNVGVLVRKKLKRYISAYVNLVLSGRRRILTALPVVGVVIL